MYWRIVAPLKRSVSIGFAGPGGGGDRGGAVLLPKFSSNYTKIKSQFQSTVCTDLLFLINKHKSINISLSSAYYPVRIAMLFIANT